MQKIRLSALAVVLGLISGCATTGQVEEVRGIANQALQEAQAANNAAETANEAKSAAEAAQQCCNEQTERLDRMFDKAMRK